MEFEAYQFVLIGITVLILVILLAIYTCKKKILSKKKEDDIKIQEYKESFNSNILSSVR